jgi:Xaa-Pro aminopeptidase
MRADRHARVQQQMEAAAVDGLVLLGTGAGAYASGISTPGSDSGRAGLFRTVVVVPRGATHPHVFVPTADQAPAGLPAECVHGPLYPDLPAGAAAMAGNLRELVGDRGRIAIDEIPHALYAAGEGWDWAEASSVLGPAKICKTPDEIACIRIAQRINELAMADAQAALRPGLRQTELSAIFLRRIFELGASWNAVDPIWQVMTDTKAAGPWTTHGDVAFPTPTTDTILREGDILWVDSGIHYEGYASDFGRTWITSARPAASARGISQYQRWQNVVDAVLGVCKPGVSGLDLGREATAANNGTRPWMQHLYLAHGIGTESAEMPLIGTDLGESFDESVVMAPGMVLVLEPIIWDEGWSGYRSEHLVVITDDGWLALSDYPYDPFEPIQ